MSAPAYTLDELLTLKQACPGRHWSVILLLLLLAEADSEYDKMTMTLIAERMRFSTAAATGLVDAAEVGGYVARFTVPGDRRLVAVKLTARGRALFESINRGIAA
jgi:DNA-binding MarR family transcriptional regulator